jgi:ABC-type uncharacterized transport system substrate-binding protein
MRRREFIIWGGAAAACPLSARAQKSTRLVGVLMAAFEKDSAAQSRLDAFRAALVKLGWTEGSNLRIDVRWGTDAALFARYAAELVELGPDVLVGEATPAAAALRRQTHSIPIVFCGITDPVGQGLVANMAHPGGNITGFSLYDAPMASKWLEMLTQISPPATRVEVLFDPATTPWASMVLETIERAASSIGVVVKPAPVSSEVEVDATMARLAREQHSGLLVLADVFTVTHRDVIVRLAAKHRLPAVYAFRAFVAVGGLMSYGVDPADAFPRAADCVDRIFRGAKPSDLPVQHPTKFDLVINMEAAKALNITVAPSLLATADWASLAPLGERKSASNARMRAPSDQRGNGRPANSLSDPASSASIVRSRLFIKYLGLFVASR